MAEKLRLGNVHFRREVIGVECDRFLEYRNRLTVVACMPLTPAARQLNF
jgi:hypothetical protein